MARVDMHVHSKYSEHPSEWFLQRLGANESYTEPEFIYQKAKERGMDFITLTDHNRIDGALLLKEAHPGDVFTGVEATTYFPEDGCKIHVLIYGLDEAEFNDIQKFRTDIYDLRAYLQARGLPHSVAHATFSENNRLSLEKLEKLMLLFDAFEGINGSRNPLNNHAWTQALAALTPERMERLQAKYRITPFSETPWLKTTTGGSDDHAGLFIGQTYTEATAATPADFLDCLKRKQTRAGGRSNDFRSFAFTLYKIAYDFSQSKSRTQGSGGWMGLLHSMVFDPKPLGVKNRFMLNTLKWQRPGNNIHLHFKELLESLHRLKSLQTDEKLPMVYDRLAGMADEFFSLLFKSFGQDLKNGDLAQLVMNISASLPGFFLSLPFFSTVKHMHRDRVLLNTLASEYGAPLSRRDQKALWFCDSAEEALAFPSRLPASERFGISEPTNLQFAVVDTDPISQQPRPPQVLPLPGIVHQPLTDALTLKVPSLLKSLEKIEAADPDVIYISTAGPAGWLGLLAARLMKIKAIGIFHQDLARHVKLAVPDEGASELADAFSRWFFNAMDEIRVPSRIYRDHLEARGYSVDKLRYAAFGIDTQQYAPKNSRRPYLQKKYWEGHQGPKLLYLRKPGDAQDFAFVCSLIQEAVKTHPDLKLMVVGGIRPEDAVHTGSLQNQLLLIPVLEPEIVCDLYTSAELLLDPGHTEVFSRTVLEAQACGLPAMVSLDGGGQEIVAFGQSGWVAPGLDRESWLRQLEQALSLMADADEYSHLRRVTRQRIVAHFDWEASHPKPSMGVHSLAAVHSC